MFNATEPAAELSQDAHPQWYMIMYCHQCDHSADFLWVLNVQRNDKKDKCSLQKVPCWAEFTLRVFFNL